MKVLVVMWLREDLTPCAALYPSLTEEAVKFIRYMLTDRDTALIPALDEMMKDCEKTLSEGHTFEVMGEDRHILSVEWNEVK